MSPCRFASLAIALLVMSLPGACAPIPVPDLNPQLGTPSFTPLAPLAEGETVAVVSAKGANDDATSIVECLRGQLAHERPDLTLINARDFRDATLPSFRQIAGVEADADLRRLLNEALIRAKSDALHLRYIVLVSGSTQPGPKHKHVGGVIGGKDGPPLFVGTGWTHQITKIRATLLDVKNAAVVGTETATASAGGPMAMFGIGFVTVPITESAACMKMARRISSVL